MSKSEDYLDGLLNSITKAKSDAELEKENAVKRQQENHATGKKVGLDEDFLEANGIDAKSVTASSSHPFLREAFSEDDFLKSFENELESGLSDDFIEAFENEIDEDERIFQETGQVPDANSVVDSLLNNINNAVKVANDADSAPEEEPETNEPDDDTYVDTMSDDDDDTISEVPDDGEELDLSFLSEDDDSESDAEEEESEEDNEPDPFDITQEVEDEPDELDLSKEEEDSSDPLSEFAPDEMDALDAKEYADGEEPNLSGDDLDLSDLLGSDNDLMDIQSILDGDEEQTDIDENAEDEPEGKKGLFKGKKKKDKGQGKEKKGNSFLDKLLLVLFGPPDEDDEEDDKKSKKGKENKVDTSSMSEEELAVLANLEGTTEGDAPAEEEGGKKKKKEKKEKPKKEKKEKPPKAPKPPKPKKEKKKREPDKSPKIPLPIIVTFLVLSLSIIGVVVVGMNYMGINRHIKQAQELYDEGNYLEAYEKLDGYSLQDEDDVLLRNQARILADIQQCQKEYESFVGREIYDFALDSLLKGLGRYEKFKDDAAEYGISDQYDSYGNMIISELDTEFGLSVDEAMEIYNQKNRHYYTVELRKVLIRLGLEE